MSDAQTTIAEVLNLFPEVKWDRFVVNDETCEVFGRWDHEDFLLLRFQGLDDATLVGWICSREHTDIAERLELEMGYVQKVSDVFGPMVPGAVG